MIMNNERINVPNPLRHSYLHVYTCKKIRFCTNSVPTVPSKKCTLLKK